MVDVDDGYTRIANELLDAILRYPFSKREMNIVFAVIRKTYGYNKKIDDISLSQLEKITGIRPSHLSPTINNLAEQKVLLKREGLYGQVLGLNKNYAQWKLLPKQEVLPKREETITETVTKLLPKREIQKTTPKDNTKRYRQIDLSAMDSDISLEAIKGFIDHRAAIKKPLTQRGLTLFLNSVSECTSLGLTKNQIIDETIEAGWQSVKKSWLESRLKNSQTKTARQEKIL